MTCCKQAENLAEAIKVLEKCDPDAHKKLLNYTQSDWAFMIAKATAAMLNAGEDPVEPTFKPHPFGTCYLVADFNFAQTISICRLISDPKLRQQCYDKAEMTYCDAIEACGDNE